MCAFLQVLRFQLGEPHLGFAYGGTTVVVGQPLDTIKTRMQAMSGYEKASMRMTAVDLYKAEGVRGFYRGGAALLLGGDLIINQQRMEPCCRVDTRRIDAFGSVWLQRRCP